MMNKAMNALISMALLILTANPVFATQNAQPNPNKILTSTVCIEQELSGQLIGRATGFLYESSEKHFLVTNKHVCEGKPGGLKPDSIILKVNGFKDDVGFPLIANKRPQWYHHNDNTIDIAVIPLTDKTFDSPNIFYLSQNDFLPSTIWVFPGDRVLVLGCPLGQYDEANKLPIMRGGIIASAYGVPFKNRPLCLIDSILLPGNSGSPVFLSPKEVWSYKNNQGMAIPGGPPNYYLLGVYSGSLLTDTFQETPGLGACWYANLIEEIITINQLR